MLTKHLVWDDGILIGYVGYSTSSDMWNEQVELTREAVVTAPRRECSAQPADSTTPHPLVKAHVDGWDFLYCRGCRCLIPPPLDEGGYAYVDYPPEWLQHLTSAQK